jgi:hypothetical protein
MIEYQGNLRDNLLRIVHSLVRFRSVYHLSNLPVVLVCALMFNGVQNFFVLLPFVIAECAVYRWLMIPKLTSRFEDYKADLEYSLRQLQEIED